jgi:hypothetical protein
MKQLILVFLVFGLTQLNAQTNKKFLLRTDFGYNYSHDDQLDINNAYSNSLVYGEINRDFEFSAGMGYRVFSGFYVGLGLSYETFKNEINPDSDTPDPIYSYPSGYIINDMYYRHSITKEKTISPFIFVQYVKNLGEKFSFAVEMYAKYEYRNSIFETDLISESNTIIIDPSWGGGSWGTPFGEIHTNGDGTYTYNYNSEMDLEYLRIGMRPSVRMDVFKNIGFSFSFRLLEYQKKTKDSRSDQIDKKSKNFNAGFKPENWLLGIYMEL